MSKHPHQEQHRHCLALMRAKIPIWAVRPSPIKPMAIHTTRTAREATVRSDGPVRGRRRRTRDRALVEAQGRAVDCPGQDRRHRPPQLRYKGNQKNARSRNKLTPSGAARHPNKNPMGVCDPPRPCSGSLALRSLARSVSAAHGLRACISKLTRSISDRRAAPSRDGAPIRRATNRRNAGVAPRSFYGSIEDVATAGGCA